jgi:dephospho-CoA kinase
MKILGLTGGVASGKTFVAEIFKKNGAVIFDADAEVHNLLESDKSVIDKVKKNFPESFVDQKIERKILGKIVFANQQKLKILEKILHTQVRKNFAEFLKNCRKKKTELVVLNIPLLLENKAYKCDKVIAIVTSKAIQKKRFLARAKKNNPKIFAAEKENLSERFEQIYAKQISNAERKKQADFFLNNSSSKALTTKQIKQILRAIS